MPQANDSVLVTPGVGATIATQAPGDGKEYQVVMLASPTGHLLDEQPTYFFQTAQIAATQNKIFFDLFNATGSGKIVRLRKLFMQSNLATQTGVGMQFDVLRTSAIGTSGTALTFTEADANDTDAPAGITCRAVPTGGATTSGGALMSPWFSSEETQPGVHVAWAENVLPEGAGIKPITIRENTGLKLVQITNSTAGSWSVFGAFTLE